MSVSVTSGNPNIDLDAIVAGGDAFTARVKELAAKKTAHDEALKSLNIGKDAVTALNEAQASRHAADQTLVDAKAEAEKIIADAHKQAFDITSNAGIEAKSKVDEAQARAATLDAETEEARKLLLAWSEKTKADANDMMAKAVAAKAAADRSAADSLAAANQIAADREKLAASQKEVDDLKASLNAKLEAVRAAAS